MKQTKIEENEAACTNRQNDVSECMRNDLEEDVEMMEAIGQTM